MGLGLGFGLDNTEDQKIKGTTKSLMAVLDITLSLIRTFQLFEQSQRVWIDDFLLEMISEHMSLVKDSGYVDSSTAQDVFSSLYCSYFVDTICRRLYKQ